MKHVRLKIEIKENKRILTGVMAYELAYRMARYLISAWVMPIVQIDVIDA